MITPLKVGNIVLLKCIDSSINNLKIVGMNDRGSYNQLDVVRLFKSGKEQKRIRTIADDEIIV